MIARTILRLGLRFLLSLLLASAVIFLLLRAIPGDPARVALGVTATDEAVARLAEQLGTDRPLAVQYLDWVGGLLTGDFGVSLSSRQDITALVLDRAQVSLILCGVAMVPFFSSSSTRFFQRSEPTSQSKLSVCTPSR